MNEYLTSFFKIEQCHHGYNLEVTFWKTFTVFEFLLPSECDEKTEKHFCG